ncbi:MAG: hypothetical protein IJV15_03640 [Lachnospiraceae bacterium]|nr:hypothetical protein [Lachnospiraceae bacterium]
MADFIGLNVLMLAVLFIRGLAGDKISKRLRYAFWLVIPVFMLVSPFVNGRLCMNRSRSLCSIM